jgi:CheY-like chemotaxis protein
MRPRVLLVDDERSIRTAYNRLLYTKYEIRTAESGNEAIKILTAEERFAVVLCDQHMQGMVGTEFLNLCRFAVPETVRVLFTGHIDVKDAVAAVNEAEVFRILLKPCQKPVMEKCIDEAVARHEQHAASKTGDKGDGAVASDAILRVLELSNPAMAEQAHRLRRYAAHVAKALHPATTVPASIAAALSVLAANTGADGVTLPVSAEAWAWLKGLPAFQRAATILSWNPDDPQTPVEATIGAGIVKVARALDRELQRGQDLVPAIEVLRKSDEGLSQALVDALVDLPMDSVWVERDVWLKDCKPGMILLSPVQSSAGLTLAPSGQALTVPLIQLLRGYERTQQVSGPLHVRAQKRSTPPVADALAPQEVPVVPTAARAAS